jgi:hypothetical protein
MLLILLVSPTWRVPHPFALFAKGGAVRRGIEREGRAPVRATRPDELRDAPFVDVSQ